jgi:hypothetical protein
MNSPFDKVLIYWIESLPFIPIAEGDIEGRVMLESFSSQIA